MTAFAYYFVIICMLGMGIIGLFAPNILLSFFGTEANTKEIRNEIRSVYGTFGIGWAIILLSLPALSLDQSIKTGILIAMALNIGFMACGRMIGLLWEPIGKWPTAFFIMELMIVLSLYINFSGNLYY